MRMPRDRGRPARVDIGSEARELIRSTCSHGNRCIAESYGVDLSAYGYCTESPGGAPAGPADAARVRGLCAETSE